MVMGFLKISSSPHQESDPHVGHILHFGDQLILAFGEVYGDIGEILGHEVAGPEVQGLHGDVGSFLG